MLDFFFLMEPEVQRRDLPKVIKEMDSIGFDARSIWLQGLYIFPDTTSDNIQVQHH